MAKKRVGNKAFAWKWLQTALTLSCKPLGAIIDDNRKGNKKRFGNNKQADKGRVVDCKELYVNWQYPLAPQLWAVV